MGQIDAVLDGKILFSEIFAGNDEEINYIQYDLSEEKQTPFTLLAEYGTDTGRFFPVIPSCSLKDEYLVVSRCDFSDASLNGGAVNALGAAKPRFAFIAKEDYWASAPQYQPLDE